MNGGVVFVIIIALVLGAAIFAIMFLTRGRGGVLNREQYQTDWLKIENSIQRGNINSYRLAILDADSLLDKALKESGVEGDTMGERLRESMANCTSVRTESGAPLRFSVSIGGHLQRDVETIDTLLRQGDQALFVAKAQQRNVYQSSVAQADSPEGS